MLGLTLPKVLEGLCSEPVGLGAGGFGVHGFGALAGVDGVGGAGFGDKDSLKVIIIMTQVILELYIQALP